METLYQEIKQLIIDSLNLEDLSVDDIETEAPLFVDGLGLDSIDALELGMAIKQKYGITPKDTPLDFDGALMTYGWADVVWWTAEVLY